MKISLRIDYSFNIFIQFLYVSNYPLPELCDSCLACSISDLSQFSLTVMNSLAFSMNSSRYLMALSFYLASFYSFQTYYLARQIRSCLFDSSFYFQFSQFQRFMQIYCRWRWFTLSSLIWIWLRQRQATSYLLNYYDFLDQDYIFNWRVQIYLDFNLIYSVLLFSSLVLEAISYYF